jgi:hypothetical protein
LDKKADFRLQTLDRKTPLLSGEVERECLSDCIFVAVTPEESPTFHFLSPPFRRRLRGGFLKSPLLSGEVGWGFHLKNCHHSEHFFVGVTPEESSTFHFLSPPFRRRQNSSHFR